MDKKRASHVECPICCYFKQPSRTKLCVVISVFCYLLLTYNVSNENEKSDRGKKLTNEKINHNLSFAQSNNFGDNFFTSSQIINNYLIFIEVFMKYEPSVDNRAQNMFV